MLKTLAAARGVVALKGELERIAGALERIAAHLELSGGSKGTFRTFYHDKAPDGSWVGYSDDVEALRREMKMIEYLRSGGTPVGPGEDIPGPVDSEGNEWSTSQT